MGGVCHALAPRREGLDSVVVLQVHTGTIAPMWRLLLLLLHHYDNDYVPLPMLGLQAGSLLPVFGVRSIACRGFPNVS